MLQKLEKLRNLITIEFSEIVLAETCKTQDVVYHEQRLWVFKGLLSCETFYSMDFY